MVTVILPWRCNIKKKRAKYIVYLEILILSTCFFLYFTWAKYIFFVKILSQGRILSGKKSKKLNKIKKFYGKHSIQNRPYFATVVVIAPKLTQVTKKGTIIPFWKILFQSC